MIGLNGLLVALVPRGEEDAKGKGLVDVLGPVGCHLREVHDPVIGRVEEEATNTNLEVRGAEC